MWVESFGWILLNSKFICVISTVPTYLGEWGERVNFGNTVAEIQQKYERERQKVGERECMNFGNVITKIPAAWSACPSVCAVCSKWDVLKKKNQLWQCIAEIGEEKKIMVTKIWGGIKKISATSIIFLQHFHNKSHVISCYWFKFELTIKIIFLSQQ